MIARPLGSEATMSDRLPRRNDTVVTLVITVSAVVVLALGGCQAAGGHSGSGSGAASPSASAASAAATAASTPAPSSARPSPSAETTCVKVADQRCDYPPYPAIAGASSDPYVDQNIWSGSKRYQQTLHAISPGNWYVTANANTHFGSVLTYPNTGFEMTGAIASYSSIESSFSTSIPDNARTAGWAAYDLWFNDWHDEVMIQTDITANSNYDCVPKARATIDGQPWHLCVFGAERVWKPGTDDHHLVNQASGTIDVRAFLTWLGQHGYLPADSTWDAASYGFEICDTGGTNEVFRVSAFSWIARK
jgi:hypothetical protein